jgi:hypothetical protein
MRVIAVRKREKEERRTLREREGREREGRKRENEEGGREGGREGAWEGDRVRLRDTCKRTQTHSIHHHGSASCRLPLWRDRKVERE